MSLETKEERVKLTPTLADIGEKRVIEAITSVAPSSINGDDAAVLHTPVPNRRTVATTDLLVEGRHFRLDWSTPEEVGHKAIVQNFADIEAMGARPAAALLGLAAPADTPISIVQGIARGIAEASSHYNTELVGGDVTQACELVVSITAIGALGGDRQALTLDRARPGQQVVAHGKIGWSAAGLALLERFGRALPEDHSELWPLIDAHCAPWITPGRGQVARATGVTAMTDNSDGLIPDLTTIAARSGVSIDLFADAIKPDPLLVQAGALLGRDPLEWVHAGGEDHTLLATTAKPAPSGFRVIGEVVRGESVTVDGRPSPYTKGWASF